MPTRTPDHAPLTAFADPLDLSFTAAYTICQIPAPKGQRKKLREIVAEASATTFIWFRRSCCPRPGLPMQPQPGNREIAKVSCV